MTSTISIGDNSLTILSNGNVGIGVTNPSSAFVLSGDMDIQGSLSTSNSYIQLGPYTSTKSGVLAWLSSETENANKNWWNNASTPILVRSNDIVANQAPFVEYLFGSLGDTGANATTLTLSGSGASGGIILQSGDETVGNYLLMNHLNDGANIVSVSAGIKTTGGTTAEVISSASGGTGLTISFDIKWVTVGNGTGYYVIGIGSSALQTTTLAVSASTTTATGFAIGRLGEFMLIDATGAFLNNATIPSEIFLSTNWTRIDIVFDQYSLTPTLYIDGAFNSTVSLSTNPVATTFTLAASAATRTHFAVEGTDAYHVANFRLWKRPLSPNEISINYAMRNSTVALYPSLTSHKGSICLPDGRVLFVPNNASNAYIYAPFTNSFSIGLPATGYNGGVLLPDGRVVFVPETATVISLYNASGNTLTTDLSATGYAGGVLLPNRSVLFVPSVAATVAIYTPYATTPTVTATQALPVVDSSLASKYSGGVLLPDGRVLLVPNAAPCLQLYNAVTNTFDTSVSGISATGYSGGVLLPDGRVLLVPNSATTLKIFDSSSLALSGTVSATGYDGGILLPNGTVMLVSNQKSELAYFNPTTSALTIVAIGALDHLGIYQTAVGCYAFRNLFKQYTGAHIRLRRAANDEIDVWFNHMGKITKYQIVAGATIVSDSITSWINSATPIYVSIWYDQSAGAKHLTQATTTVQPQFEYDKLLGGYCVKFTGTESMSAGNLFATNTITDMQCILRVRDTAVSDQYGISFNGTGGNFYMHMPWGSDSVWYWDASGSKNNRAVSVASITSIGAVAQVSAYKSLATTNHGFTVNSFTYASAAGTNTAVTVSNGLQIGGNGSFSCYKGFFQYLITLNTRTSDANTRAVFDILKDTTGYYNGGSLIPDGRVILTPTGANNFGIVSGFAPVSIERCIHPCFNKF